MFGAVVSGVMQEAFGTDLLGGGSGFQSLLKLHALLVLCLQLSFQALTPVLPLYHF